MPTLETYKGSCHCGKIRYEVDLDLAAGPVMACNCSMCSRAGWILTFTTPEHFRLLSDEGTAEYLFNKHVVHHRFCATCGIKAYARGTDGKGKESIAINVRCLEGVEPRTLKVSEYDGRRA